MKKFKNSLVIKGSLSLLKAFAEELTALGYNSSFFSEDPSWTVEVTHLLVLPNSGFGFHNHSCVNTTVTARLELPTQWDEALKLASELQKEEIKMGDWVVSFTSGYTFRVSYMDNLDCIFNKDGNFIYKEGARRARNEEIEHWLIKETIEKGFVYESTFEAVRDSTIEDWVRKDEPGWAGYKKENGKVGSVLVYNPNTDTLTTAGFGIFVLYERGKWATLNKREEIVIMGYQADFSTPKVVKFGCQEFTAEQIYYISKSLNVLNTELLTKIYTNIYE